MGQAQKIGFLTVKGGKRNGERTKKGKTSKRKKATIDNRKHASEKEKRDGKGERQKIGLR